MPDESLALRRAKALLPPPSECDTQGVVGALAALVAQCEKDRIQGGAVVESSNRKGDHAYAVRHIAKVTRVTEHPKTVTIRWNSNRADICKFDTPGEAQDFRIALIEAMKRVAS